MNFKLFLLIFQIKSRSLSIMNISLQKFRLFQVSLFCIFQRDKLLLKLRIMHVNVSASLVVFMVVSDQFLVLIGHSVNLFFLFADFGVHRF
jgi:hypothetical protein